MKLKFTKMQGLGNDFMVVDGINQVFHFSNEQIGQWGDRRFGIGFDQLLLVEKSTLPGIDFKYRIFNCDGSEVEQCGNGSRCFVRFVHEQGLTDKTQIRVETAKGTIVPRLEGNGLVTVDMGMPFLDPVDIPFVADAQAITYGLDVDGERYEIGAVSMGNPHAVLVVDDVDAYPVRELGARIEVHPRFPRKVNVGFLQVIDRSHIKLRVFERAAGETLACGTGACAAVVSGIQRGLLDPTVTVSTRGGELTISWAGEGQPVLMTGPAVTVYHGEIEV
ncbi:diaminopimelate epimerase [Chitinivorax sp. PXF-14]|uniref:diaminopimelate epimerase n=1 Tax=Chitinivorax sp. PXF-14 TaxID=3230488 RepID=UPI003465DDAB